MVAQIVCMTMPIHTHTHTDKDISLDRVYTAKTRTTNRHYGWVKLISLDLANVQRENWVTNPINLCHIKTFSHSLSFRSFTISTFFLLSLFYFWYLFLFDYMLFTFGLNARWETETEEKHYNWMSLKKGRSTFTFRLFMTRKTN